MKFRKRDVGETEQGGKVKEKEGDPSLVAASCPPPKKKAHALASTPEYRGRSFPRVLVVPRI